MITFAALWCVAMPLLLALAPSMVPTLHPTMQRQPSTIATLHAWLCTTRIRTATLYAVQCYAYAIARLDCLVTLVLMPCYRYALATRHANAVQHAVLAWCIGR